MLRSTAVWRVRHDLMTEQRPQAEWAEEKPVLSSRNASQPGLTEGLGRAEEAGRAQPPWRWGGVLPPEATGQVSLNHCSDLGRSAAGIAGLPSAAAPQKTPSKNIRSPTWIVMLTGQLDLHLKKKNMWPPPPVTLSQGYAATENIWSKGT